MILRNQIESCRAWKFVAGAQRGLILRLLWHSPSMFPLPRSGGQTITLAMAFEAAVGNAEPFASDLVGTCCQRVGLAALLRQLAGWFQGILLAGASKRCAAAWRRRETKRDKKKRDVRRGEARMGHRGGRLLTAKTERKQGRKLHVNDEEKRLRLKSTAISTATAAGTQGAFANFVEGCVAGPGFHGILIRICFPLRRISPSMGHLLMWSRSNITHFGVVRDGSHVPQHGGTVRDHWP